MNKPATYALTMLMGLSASVAAPAVFAAQALSNTELDALTVNHSRTKTTKRDAADAYSAIRTRWTESNTLTDKQSSERQIAGSAATFGSGDSQKRETFQGAQAPSTTQTLASTSSGAALSATASQTQQSTGVSSTQTPNTSTSGTAPAGSEGGATQGADASSTQAPLLSAPNAPQFPSMPSSIQTSRPISVGNLSF